MAYDAADGYVLAVDGQGNTYSYSAGLWTLLHPTPHPTSRAMASLAFDPIDNETILFGGTAAAWGGPPYFNDTWEYRAGNWTNDSGSIGPSPRAGAAMVYDARDGYLLLEGGYWSGPHSWAYTDDTWSYSQKLHAIAFAKPDVVDVGRLESFHGAWTGTPTPNSLQWSFGDGAGGTSAGSAHAYSTPGTYRATFWANSSSPLSSVNSSVTVTAVPALGPLTLSAAPNPTDVGTPVNLSASFTGGVAPYNYSWESGYSNASEPSATASFSYPTPGKFVALLEVRDSDGDTTNASLSITVNPAPSSTGLVAIPADTDVGLPIVFTQGSSGGSAPISYAWDFGVPGANTVGASASTSYEYASPETYLVTAWANDSLGESTSSSLTVVVQPKPAVTIEVTPNPSDLSSPVAFSISGSGGTAPFTETWSFGDGSTSTSGEPTHRYTAQGSYTVSLEWRDSVGESAFANATVIVGPALSASLSVSSTNVSLGQSVLFSATASGGDPPYGYTWAHLPPGCISVDGGTIGCLPTQAGVYPVSLNITDGNSAWAVATITLSVTFDFTLIVITPTPHVGQGLGIDVQSSTPAADLKYSYSGLPPGCESENASLLTCTPTLAGTYTVTVTVTDFLVGIAVSHEILLHVGAAPSSLSPLTELLLVGLGGFGLGAVVLGAVWRFYRPSLLRGK